LKSTVKKEMNGVQLVAYFLWICVQLLKARISKMWSYYGLKDKSSTSKEVPKEFLHKQVHSLTKMTKKDKIPPCPAKPFSISKPLPKV
jgi:hypothetical protein